jgi:hypothetical protein
MGVNVTDGLHKYVKMMVNMEDEGVVAAPNMLVHPVYIEL